MNTYKMTLTAISDNGLSSRTIELDVNANVHKKFISFATCGEFLRFLMCWFNDTMYCRKDVHENYLTTEQMDKIDDFIDVCRHVLYNYSLEIEFSEMN